MSDTFIQVRTNEEDKEKAAAILAELGTNTSAVVNMLLKQIIRTRSIPFEIKLSKKVSPYKKDDLQRVLSCVTDSVDEIWVFGSTVTDFCRPDSDLDICIVGCTSMEEEAAMYNAACGAVDIITQTVEGFAKEKQIPGSIYKEVSEKGLLVYKKGEKVEWE